MDKKRILEILEGAKDDNGEIPMSLVRKAFEKIEEPCEDAVSRQAVINIINKPVIIKAKEQIEALPQVQPKRKTGHWINILISATEESEAGCDQCGCVVHNSFSNSLNYCPNCGAEMKGDCANGYRKCD